MCAMSSPRSGIFALGTASHAYLEFDATGSKTRPALVEAIAGLREPRTTMGGVNLVAILLVLRTGMQWNALNATGICSSSSAHRRFQEWEQAGLFHEIWRQGLLEYDCQG